MSLFSPLPRFGQSYILQAKERSAKARQAIRSLICVWRDERVEGVSQL
ncbi:MAG: hypothetical protein WBB29_12305 [Geitlerinemataceae cyanobacterium]